MAVAAWLAACATSDTEAEREPREEAALAAKAAQVLQGQAQQPEDQRIPKALVGGARCIGVFPSVLKAGLVIGGQRGSGLVSCRKEGGDDWSDAAPAFYTLKSGSIGLQAGVQSSQLILLFLTDEGVDSLLGSRFTLGSDLRIAAGPVGEDASFRGAPAPVLGYSRSATTMFSGINLEGSVLSFAEGSNQAVYDQAVIGALEILFGRFEVPGSVDAFTQALGEFAPQSERRELGETHNEQ